MATEATLKEGALIAAEAIHDYAKLKGWPLDKDQAHYHIFMTINTDLESLSIVVVSSSFDGRDESVEVTDYYEVMDRLDRALKKKKIFNYYGLVLTGKNGYSFYPSPRLGKGQCEIDERLINHGVSWSESFRTHAL